MKIKQVIKRMFVNAANLQWIRNARQSALIFYIVLKQIYRETKFIFPEYRIISFGKRILTVIWCFPFFRRASTWLASAENPLLAKEFLHTPEIREFIFRPYVNKNWNATQRLDVIEEHYILVCSNAAILNLAPDEYIDLAIFELVCGNLRVVLDRPNWLRREGEIGLSLFLGIDRVYTVMFLLSGSDTNMKLIIGCVQGSHINPSCNPYKVLTKELYRMRPRDLILHITKIFSEELGCEEILGVSDAAHRSGLWYSQATKNATYDEMWLEHGGKKVSNDFFSLPARFIKHTDTTIEPRKRAIYRRRYQFLDDLHLLLREAIKSPPQKKYHQWANKSRFHK